MCRCNCARTIRPDVIDYREPEIKDCACGQDHVTMPMIQGDCDGPLVEAVCRIHKTHIPCRRCARERPDVIEVVTRTAQRNEQNNCRICGGNPDAIVNAVKLGMQMAAFDTYQPNLAATAEREAVEAARQSVNRWHET